MMMGNRVLEDCVNANNTMAGDVQSGCSKFVVGGHASSLFSAPYSPSKHLCTVGWLQLVDRGIGDEAVQNIPGFRSSFILLGCSLPLPAHSASSLRLLRSIIVKDGVQNTTTVCCSCSALADNPFPVSAVHVIGL